MHDSTVMQCFLGIVGGAIAYWLGGFAAVMVVVLGVATGMIGGRMYQRAKARPE